MENSQVVVLLGFGLLVVAFLSFQKNPAQFVAALWVRLTTLAVKLGGAALALLYIIWPVDLVPDIILFVGWLDDLVAGGVGVHLLKQAFAFPNPFTGSSQDQKTKNVAPVLAGATNRGNRPGPKTGDSGQESSRESVRRSALPSRWRDSNVERYGGQRGPRREEEVWVCMKCIGQNPLSNTRCYLCGANRQKKGSTKK